MGRGADERGSVVAVSDDAGNAGAINRYDEYGIPASTNVGRFGYEIEHKADCRVTGSLDDNREPWVNHRAVAIGQAYSLSVPSLTDITTRMGRPVRP